MKEILSGAMVYQRGTFQRADVFISEGRITDISQRVPKDGEGRVSHFSDCFIVPGFVDVHVHLREPGFFYKETIASGTMAAAHGGYQAVCAMPNLSPVPDSAEHLRVQTDIIDRDANVRVYPYAAITRGQKGAGELIDFDAVKDAVIGFSDDGRGIQEEALMEEAMRRIKPTGRILAAHCEVDSLLNGGVIHAGEYARIHGHRGISSESEWREVVRDIKLAARTGCPYHVCHVSSKESVQAIREAKRAGIDITCETAPHYLIYHDMELQEDGRFKMNPPIRAAEDRDALIEGVLDGTIDMLATDHAPHSAAEKSRGLDGSLMGVVGLETAFAVMYTRFVKTGILSLEKLIDLMSCAPRRRFGIAGELAIGQMANFTVLNLNAESTVDPDTFLSKGRATPFAGMRVCAEVVRTYGEGQIRWTKDAR